MPLRSRNTAQMSKRNKATVAAIMDSIRWTRRRRSIWLMTIQCQRNLARPKERRQEIIAILVTLMVTWSLMRNKSQRLKKERQRTRNAMQAKGIWISLDTLTVVDTDGRIDRRWWPPCLARPKPWTSTCNLSLASSFIISWCNCRPSSKLSLIKT